MKYISVTHCEDAANIEAVNGDSRCTISEYQPAKYSMYDAAQIAMTLQLPFIVNGFSRNPNDVPKPKS